MAEHTKEARVDRAKGRVRGMFLVLIAGDGDGPDGQCYKIVADENAALVTDADVRAWMEENEYVGSVWPVRFLRGKDSIRRSFTRSVQQVFSITQE